MTSTKQILMSTGTLGGLVLTSALMAQGMMGGRHMMMDDSMQCPALGEHYRPMMHATDVNLSVKNLDNGVQITWTTTNKEKVQTLQNMGQHMQQMHARLRSQNNNNGDKEEK